MYLSGCGSSPTDAVGAKVRQFAHAVAAGDAPTLCDQVLAPALVTRLTDAGISCPQAMKTFVQSVQDPTISVGKVTVSGRSASAVVTTGAEGPAGLRGHAGADPHHSPGGAWCRSSRRADGAARPCSTRQLAREQPERDHVLAPIGALHVGAQHRLAGEAGALRPPAGTAGCRSRPAGRSAPARASRSPRRRAAAPRGWRDPRPRASRGQPVADLGPRVLPGEAHQRDRAHQAAVIAAATIANGALSPRRQRRSGPAGTPARRTRRRGWARASSATISGS